MQPHLQAAPADPPGVIKLYLINAARLLAWGAYGALVYVCLLRGLELARDTAVPLIIGKVLFWEIKTPISIWFPLFPVAFALAGLLPLATKYCIAFIVSIKGKDPLSRWAKCILAIITLACIVSTLTATGPLMIESSAGKYREAAVKGELVEARLGAEKQIYADMQQSLQTMKDGKSVESAAAREGVAGWSAKVAIAKKQLDAGQLDQARYDRIERASSTAAAREDLERQMREQQVKIASLPTASTAVASVKSDESHGAQEFAETTSAWWPLVSFFALEMIAVFFGLIQLVLEMTRDRQLADWEAVHAQPTEDAGIDMRITDGTDQWQPVPNETTYDEEGNELIPVRRRKEVHYRRKPKPKKDESQAPIGASDPRASAANQLELQEEVSDESVSSENREREMEAAELEGAEGLYATDHFNERGVSASGEAPESIYEPAASDDLASGLVGEHLTHAQPEEDQQADEPVDDEAAFSLDSSSDEVHAAETACGNFDEWAGRSDQNEIVSSEQGAETIALNAPLETPDEQALWNEVSETSELAEPENAETPLPNGEGIVVWDDEEEPTIKELLARTEAAE